MFMLMGDIIYVKFVVVLFNINIIFMFNIIKNLNC